MEKENIDLDGLSMEKLFDKLTPAEFKQLSPSQKINIQMDNELFVVGFNLVCKKQKDLKYDKKDLSAKTIVVINTHHLLECIQMISGAIFCASTTLKLNLDIHEYVWEIISIINNNIVKFGNIETIVTSIINDISTKANIYECEVLQRLSYVLRYIWFLPYGEIDKIKDEIRKELGDKNE